MTISQTTLNAEIQTNLPTNGTGQITAAILRTTLTDMVSATFQNQGSSGYSITNSPSIGAVPVGVSSSSATWGFTFPALMTFSAGISVTGGSLALNSTSPSFTGTFSITSVNPLTGSYPSGLDLNSIIINTDEINSGSNNTTGLHFNHTFGSSSAFGSRVGIQVNLTQSSPTNASNTTSIYTALNIDATSVLGDNGTGGTPNGSYFGLSAAAILLAGATNCFEASAVEFNTQCFAGSSVRSKYGVKIVQVPTDAVAGSSLDAAFFAGNSFGAIGWKTIFQLGDGQTNNPLQTTGTVMKFIGGGTIGTGIDLSNVTITGNAFASTNFTLGGTGVLSLYSSSYSQGTAGTSIFKFSDTNFYFDNYNGNLVWRGTSFATLMELFNSGGFYVGSTPVDPGANNLTVQAGIKGGGSLALNQPVTISASTKTQAATDAYYIVTTASTLSPLTITLIAASTVPGQMLWINNAALTAIVSASSNVVLLGGSSASPGTTILASTSTKYIHLVAVASVWQAFAAN